MKKFLNFKVATFALTLAVCGFNSCKEDKEEPEKPKRPDKEITSFSIPTLNLTGVIDATKLEITLTVAPDYDQTNLVGVVPKISYSTGASITPEATAPQDFSKNVEYTVTAEDGTSQKYTVKLVLSPFTLGIAKMTEVWKKEDWTALGLAANSENTMAIIGDKLVASRSGKLFDAATGEPANATLSIEGVADGTFNGPNVTLSNQPFVVTNDDAGNLIGVSLGAWTKPHTYIYKWSSATTAPTLVYDLNCDTLVQFGRKISVVGDINGAAYIIQYNHDQARKSPHHDGKQYVWKVTGGNVDATPTIVLARTPVDNSYYQTMIPMSTSSVYPFYVAAAGASNIVPPSGVGYQKDQSTELQWIKGFLKDEGEGPIISSNWGSYVLHMKKFNFNGKVYMAVASVRDPDAEQFPDWPAMYYLTVMDTETNTVVARADIPRGAALNGNWSLSVTTGPEETKDDGEHTIRLYSLFTNTGIYCHELTNKVGQ